MSLGAEDDVFIVCCPLFSDAAVMLVPLLLVSSRMS